MCLVSCCYCAEFRSEQDHIADQLRDVVRYHAHDPTGEIEDRERWRSRRDEVEVVDELEKCFLRDAAFCMHVRMVDPVPERLEVLPLVLPNGETMPKAMAYGW